MVFKTTKGLTEKHLKLNHLEYYDEMSRLIIEDGLSISERIWLFQNNLKERPKCLNESCHNKTKFIKFYRGYRKYCSKSCAALDTHRNRDTKVKRIEKLLECNFDVEKRLEMTNKSKQTKLNFSNEKRLSINNKRIKTNIEKWGVENISTNKEIRIKISKRLREIIPNLKLEKTSNRIKEIGFSSLRIDDNKNYELNCVKCNSIFKINQKLFNQRNRFDIEICLNCNPNNNNSDFENKVLDFVKNNYSGQIIPKFRKFKRYEIDIYLPELNLGIECNGLFWHSEKYKENNYHIEKTNFFKENGINIIHIWEDDWKLKSHIVKSRLVNSMKLTSNSRINAKNCIVRELTDDEIDKFLNYNHLNGNIKSKIKVGLFYKEEIISAMSFKEIENNEFEILRFCSKINTNVQGGASKILNFFCEKYKPRRIVSYLSLDWPNLSLHERLGFKFIKNTEPNQFYFHKDTSVRIVDSFKSEMGFYRICDTGYSIYEKIFK